MKKFFIIFLMSIMVLSGCGSDSSQPVSDESANSEMVFTKEMLAEYNGENGQPAYIAIEGVVYDVSDVAAWNGGHQGQYLPGKDYSNVITGASHGKGVLKDLPVVGTYEEGESDSGY